MLDENSMPIIQEGELQRDPNSAKTRQPVMRIVELEKEVREREKKWCERELKQKKELKEGDGKQQEGRKLS